MKRYRITCTTAAGARREEWRRSYLSALVLVSIWTSAGHQDVALQDTV